MTNCSSISLLAQEEVAGEIEGALCAGQQQCYGHGPRTNNDLEHYFGAARRQERRATGRKSATAGLVVRGPVRGVAAVATSVHPFTGPELRPTAHAQWQALRQTLE
jgi:hypothetical protein